MTGRWALCGGVVLVRATVRGYGGPMLLMYTLRRGDAGRSGTEPGTEPAPEIGRVRVVRHQETPGLTDFLRQPDSGWLAMLEARDATSLAAVDAVSGATITSRALLDHLEAALGAGNAGLPAEPEPCP